MARERDSAASRMIDQLKLLSSLVEPSRYRVWWAYFAVGLLIALLETATGVLYLGLIASFNGVAPDTGRIAGIVASLPRGADPILVLSVLLITIVVIKSFATVVMVYLRAACVDGAFVGLAQRLVAAYLNAPYEMHLRRHSGELIKNVQMAMDVVSRTVLLGIATVIGEALIIVALVGLAVIVAPGIALSVAAGLLGFVWLLTRALKGEARDLGAEQQEIAKESHRQLTRAFDLLKEIKLYGKGDRFANAYALLRRRQALSLRRVEVMGVVPGVSSELVIVVLVAGAANWIAHGAMRDPSMLGLIGLLAYIALRLRPSVTRATVAINGIRLGMKAVEIVTCDLELERDRQAQGEGNDPPIRIEQTIELRDIAYSYPDRQLETLSGISLTIQRGETIGIVGASGSGKSTLSEILLGLLRPSAGEILVDGRPIDAAGRRWKSGLGYVPQVVALLDDTLLRNIVFDFADDDIDQNKITEIVRMSQLREVIAALPNGIETVLGENGLGLSGGQRQRVAIARALYRQPQLLVFDEATSGLDAETEREVTSAIEHLYGSITIIIVAHRLSTLRKCDRIVRMEGGKIQSISSGSSAVMADALLHTGTGT